MPHTTYTPLPTHTLYPMPTSEPQPTYTLYPVPTSEPLPTATPYPTHTPYPTYTPLPTRTSLPTPTPTASPTIPTLTPPPRLALPFEDDFNDGPRPEWQAKLGRWRMVDDMYACGPSESLSLTIIGDESWKDYAVDVDVDYRDWNYSLSIIVRGKGNSYVKFKTNCCDSSFVLVEDGD